jgi:hypothetical protein
MVASSFTPSSTMVSRLGSRRQNLMTVNGGILDDAQGTSSAKRAHPTPSGLSL